MFMFEYQDLLDSKKPHCVACGTDMTGQIIDFYPHEYGWAVDGYQKPQWLSFHCTQCGYDTSLNKVGIPRAGWDMTEAQLYALHQKIEASGNNKCDDKPFTAQDAFERISVAKAGSLWDERLTAEYLITLHRGVANWLREIEAALNECTPEI